MTKQLVDRFRFSIPEVARAMLEDQIEDCERWDIRVEGGMVIIDVVEPATARAGGGAGAVTVDDALEVLRGLGDVDFAELMENEIGERKDRARPTTSEAGEDTPAEETGGIASTFKAETDAAVDQIEDEAAAEAEDDGSNDPFWDEPPEGEASEEEDEGSVQQTDPHYWAKIAGIICGQPGFWKFIFASNKDEAAVKLRQKCGIESRRELDTNQDALIKFKDLKAEYAVWLDGG
jgi:hypothetical protein